MGRPSPAGSRNPFVERERPAPVLLNTTPITEALWALQPIERQQVRRTADGPLCNSLIAHYDYLGYEQPVGEHLKYLACAQGRPIACLACRSALRHLGSRDRYIGSTRRPGGATSACWTTTRGV